MEVLASPFLFEATLLLEAALFLEAADPGCLLVLALGCNVKKMVEQDLRTKRIVNFACGTCPIALVWLPVIADFRVISST